MSVPDVLSFACQIEAAPGVTCLAALREGLEQAEKNGWTNGFLLDLHKMRLTIDSADMGMWARARGDGAESAIALETILFKTLCMRFSGARGASYVPYWLPVANAPDLRAFPFDSAAKTGFLARPHDSLTPALMDSSLRQIERDHFDHLIDVVLPGIARSAELAAKLAPGPVFVLKERLFGSSDLYAEFMTREKVEKLSRELEALSGILGGDANPALAETRQDIAQMQFPLAATLAQKHGAFVVAPTLTPVPTLN